MNTEFLLWLVNGLLAMLGAFGFWQLKRFAAQLDKSQESVTALALKVAENYATKHELTSVLGQILERLNQIDHKLDRKVDKE